MRAPWTAPKGVALTPDIVEKAIDEVEYRLSLPRQQTLIVLSPLEALALVEEIYNLRQLEGFQKREEL